MGQDFSQCWESAFLSLATRFAVRWRVRRPFLKTKRMFLDRLGYLEETFFTVFL